MGPRDAVGFFGYPSDQPVGPILRWKLAGRRRDFFVWVIFFFLVIERRFPGFSSGWARTAIRSPWRGAHIRKTAEPSL